MALRDSSVDEGPLPDLTVEENARQWILQEPKSFCNSADGNILSGPTYYERDKDKYIKFLREGIDKYNSKLKDQQSN